MFQSNLRSLYETLNRPELRFLINSGVSASLYIAVLWLAGTDTLSNVVIFCAVSVVNYLGSKYFVFQNTGGHMTSMMRFFALVASSIGLNAVFVWVCAEIFSLPYYIAGILFLLVWAVISFLFQKYWVFGD